MQIGVLGLGATGGLFATLLAQHNEVHVLARGARGAHALTSGLRLTGHADLEVALPAERVHLLDAPGATPPTLTMDAVLLCVKAHQVEEVAAMLPAFSRPRVVAYLETGSASWSGLLVLCPVTSLPPAQRTGPCEPMAAPRRGPAGARWLSAHGQAVRPMRRRSAGRLPRCSGLSARIVDDARRQIWIKALLNIAINPLCALAGVRNGEMLHTPLFDAAVGLLMEAELVGRRHGVDLPSMDELVTTLVDVLDATAENRCSMLEDVRVGRATEIDALNGHIVNLAEQHGLMATQNAQVTALIHALRR